MDRKNLAISAAFIQTFISSPSPKLRIEQHYPYRYVQPTTVLETSKKFSENISNLLDATAKPISDARQINRTVNSLATGSNGYSVTSAATSTGTAISSSTSTSTTNTSTTTV